MKRLIGHQLDVSGRPRTAHWRRRGTCLVVTLLTTFGTVALVPSAQSGAVPRTDGGGGDEPASGGFIAIKPFRLMDTREGLGGGVFQADESRDVATLGVGGVPSSGVVAVELNITVTEPTSAGYLTVYPAGVARPTSSSLNFVVGQTVPNAVTVGLGDVGAFTIYNSSGTSHVIADVVGWHGTSGGFTSVTPFRVADTREGRGGPVLTSLQPRDVVVAGVGGVPTSGAGAVVLNVTVTEPSTAGYLTVYPTGVTPPNASNLNFLPGQSTPNAVTVGVGTGGSISVITNAATAHVVVDIVGWFASNQSVGGYTAVTPSRIVDTRERIGGGSLNGGEGRDVVVSGIGSTPATEVSAVVLNVTVTNPSNAGFLTLFPDGLARPTASQLNFVPGQTVPNSVTVGVGPSGAFTVFLSGGAADVIIDVVGWYGITVLPSFDEPATDGAGEFGLRGKWDHNNLTYRFINGTPDISGDEEQAAVRRALSHWSDVTPLTFTLVAGPADLEFSWLSGAHGDAFPFDGRFGVLAHVFYPTGQALQGDVHFDEAENWVTGGSGIDLETVALHEIGHALGLAHSENRGAVMYPSYSAAHRYLHTDDIAGIQALYGPRPITTAPPRNPVIALSKGTANGSGFWYSVTLSGFTPNVSVIMTCRDSVAGGFVSVAVHIDSSGAASTPTLCSSANAADHWVSGGGVDSNHVSWQPTPPPTTPSTTTTTTAPPSSHVVLAQGDRNPAAGAHAFWYIINLSGFPANSTVTVSCNLSSSGAFYTRGVTVDASGNGFAPRLCWAEGGDHWVTANGLASNHVPWDLPVPPAVVLSRGEPNTQQGLPGAYWYTVQLTGFAPNSAVAVTCYATFDPSGFYTRNITVDANGNAATTRFCWATGGSQPDHWLSANGIQSNHVPW